MKQCRVVVLIAALLLLAATMASAQFRRQPNGGLVMLGVSQVQTELKMTPDEIAKIEPAQEQVRSDVPRPAGGFQGDPADMAAFQEKRFDANDAAVKGILTPDQYTRYQQLEYQQIGNTVLEYKSVQTALGLTPDEVSKTAAAQTTRTAAMQGIDFQSMTDADRQKLTDIRATEAASDLAALTPAHQAAWKTMQGTAFTFPPPQPQ